MGYRDETESLRAKVEGLEDELGDARETIAKLRGEVAEESAPGPSTYSAILGTDRQLVLERELPFEIDSEGYEAIAALLTERFGLSASQVGRNLTAGVFSLTVKDGATTLRCFSPAGGQAAGVLSGGVMLGLFGTMATVSVGHDLAHMTPAQLTVLAGVAFASIAPALAYAFRGLVRRGLIRDRNKLRAAFERMAELAQAHSIKAPLEPPRVRVESAAGATAAQPEEVEIEAAADPAGEAIVE